MRVGIKRFGVDMEVKNTGVEFQVHDNNGNHKGDCYVTKAGLIWCRGRTTKKNGVRVSWENFAEWMEEE